MPISKFPPDSRGKKFSKCMAYGKTGNLRYFSREPIKDRVLQDNCVSYIYLRTRLCSGQSILMRSGAGGSNRAGILAQAKNGNP